MLSDLFKRLNKTVMMSVALIFTCTKVNAYMLTLDDFPQDRPVTEFVASFRPDTAETARTNFRNNLYAAAHILLADALDHYNGVLSAQQVRYRKTVAHLLECRINRPELQRYFRPVPAEMDAQVARVVSNNERYIEVRPPALNPPPRPVRHRRSIPESSYTKGPLDQEETCSICQEDSKELCKLKKCSHFFHPECISTWYKIKNSCPMCRKKIVDD